MVAFGLLMNRRRLVGAAGLHMRSARDSEIIIVVTFEVKILYKGLRSCCHKRPSNVGNFGKPARN